MMMRKKKRRRKKKSARKISEHRGEEDNENKGQKERRFGKLLSTENCKKEKARMFRYCMLSIRQILS